MPMVCSFFHGFHGESVKSKNQLTMDTGNTNSRESHIKQKALAQERKAAKPNSDLIARSKKLWERLRRKSHVPKDERVKLVAELFDIITGRVRDFVLKHDSVRVIQTALKYATPMQRKEIAKELKGEYKTLAESRYAKFLIGKLLVHGDAEIRDMIVPEFYGNVRRLVRHPEAAWILDDIYRTVATKDQKARLLREWYGAEFVVFQAPEGTPVEGDLKTILEESPEKRGPIMRYLFELINLLVQKKTYGFTILHDAMLQYFINTHPPTTEESTAFLTMLRDDEEGDLLKNLAFTASGSKIVCYAFAYANAKDRKNLLKVYKDTFMTMAGDVHAYKVILAAYDFIDDTKLSGKAIFPELLSQNASEEARNEELLNMTTHLTARIPLVYLFTPIPVDSSNSRAQKWLLPPSDSTHIQEMHTIRKETSKKEAEIRRRELVAAIAPVLMTFITSQAEALLQTSFGCQMIAEILLCSATPADDSRTAALNSIATIAAQDPAIDNAPLGRMLKSLVQGGKFDPETKKIDILSPPLGFDALFYGLIKEQILEWATGPNSFVVVGLLEAEGFEAADKKAIKKTLKKNKKALEEVAGSKEEKVIEKKAKKGKKEGEEKPKVNKGNTGARILLQQLE